MSKSLEDKIEDLCEEYYANLESCDLLPGRGMSKTLEDKIEDLCEEYYANWESYDLLPGRIMELVHKEIKDTAQQAYLECVAVESGEGECARAIKTKWGLE